MKRLLLAIIFFILPLKGSELLAYSVRAKLWGSVEEVKAEYKFFGQWLKKQCKGIETLASDDERAIKLILKTGIPIALISGGLITSVFYFVKHRFKPVPNSQVIPVPVTVAPKITDDLQTSVDSPRTSKKKIEEERTQFLSQLKRDPEELLKVVLAKDPEKRTSYEYIFLMHKYKCLFKTLFDLHVNKKLDVFSIIDLIGQRVSVHFDSDILSMAGGLIDKRDDYGDTLLLAAIKADNISAFQSLLLYGADSRIVDLLGNDVQYYANYHSNSEYLRFLRRKSDDVCYGQQV